MWMCKIMNAPGQHIHIARMNFSRCCCIAVLLLCASFCNIEGQEISQTCRSPAFMQREHFHQFGHTCLQTILDCRTTAFSLRGGADDNTELEEKEAYEPSKPRLFSFFRQRPWIPSMVAAVDRSNANADKIPHGPTGGGYATMAPNAESIDDGDVLLISNNGSAEREGTRISTYPSAFAINQGHSLKSIKEMRSGTGSEDSSTDETTINIGTDNKTSTKNATSTRGHSKLSEEESAEVYREKNTTSSPHGSNLTKTFPESSNAASNITETSDRHSNASIINISISGSFPCKNAQDYTSSGYWVGIDLLASFGLSTISEELKISRVLRPVRKAAAQATGLHGFLSGKPMSSDSDLNEEMRRKQPTVISIDEELGIHDAIASEAEVTARKLAKPLTRRQQKRMERRAANRNRKGMRWGMRRGNNLKADPEYIVIPVRVLDESPNAIERRRRKRVEEIDELLKRGSARLMELQCEKDDLQQAPNPLFNYTKQHDESTNKTFGDVRTNREFNFPSQVLVEDYIDELVSSGRLICLNHTDLWQNQPDNDLDDDEIGDDLFTPSGDASKLYQNLDQLEQGIRKGKKSNTMIYAQNSGGGSWLLRTGFGNGGSLGEKLGETIETQAYKAVTASVMMVLARILSALHGINVMNHSDIRLYVEDDPDLPPIEKEFGSMGRDNYAQHAIKTVIQKGSKKKRRHGSKSHAHSSSRRHGHELCDAAFIQRDAVVETLISHCQISAPLLKLFPIDWQRAIVGNIITLVTAIISDFADGIQLQILGHSLSFSFKPITEADLFQHIGVGGFRQNHRRSRPHEFEYAVWATAQDISKSLSFLGDGWLGWLEKKIGGGILISQLSNLIARVVLTLIDEVLSGARLDLWSSQANGPRLYAAMEYRTTNKEEAESI